MCTNVATFKCRHICLATFTHNLIIHWLKSYLWRWKLVQILRIKRKTISELIHEITEFGIAWRTWNGSTSIVDKKVSVDSVLSNPHRHNGVSKVIDILLSDFVSRGAQRFLWRHHGHEIKQLKSANASTKSVSLLGAKSERSDIRLAFQANVTTLGSDFSGIAACRMIHHTMMEIFAWNAHARWTSAR